MKTSDVVGLAFVALVISGLVVLTFAGVKPDQPVEILRNEYPSILSPGKSTFSFSIVARERFGQVELRFAVLVPKDLIPQELLEPDLHQDASTRPEDLLGNVRKLAWFGESTSQLGIEPEGIDGTVTVGGRQYELLIHDFSTTIGCRLGPSLLGQNVTENVPLTFAVVMNETHHQYLEGGLDFFAKPSVNLRNLLISHNEKETKYVADEEVREGSGRLPVSQAPRGIVRVESVQIDDTITVVMGIEPLQFELNPQGPVALLQIVGVYLDGEAFGEPVVNAVKRGELKD